MSIKECDIMELAVEMREMANHLSRHLNDHEKLVIVEVMRKFLPDNIATAEDLEDIRIAREEYARGETTKHSDIDWD